MIACKQCQKPVKNHRVGLINARIMGDSYTEAYFLCPDCGVYTLVIFRDSFTGGESMSLYGPLSRADGDAKLAVISRCPDPTDDRCECPAHHEYFGSWLG
jgi:hypothetical protein